MGGAALHLSAKGVILTLAVKSGKKIQKDKELIKVHARTQNN